jgi:hypothetical protein
MNATLPKISFGFYQKSEQGVGSALEITEKTKLKNDPCSVYLFENDCQRMNQILFYNNTGRNGFPKNDMYQKNVFEFYNNTGRSAFLKNGIFKRMICMSKKNGLCNQKNDLYSNSSQPKRGFTKEV